MAKSSRGTRKSKGLFRRVYSPIDHLIEAGRNISRAAFKRSGRIVNNGLGLVGNVGKSVAGHANKTVSNIVGRKNRKDRKDRKDRKSRKQTRRNRK
jgi:hypothetical protein